MDTNNNHNLIETQSPSDPIYSVGIAPEDMPRFSELRNMYSNNTTDEDVIKYLLSLERTAFDQGKSKVERKLMQWFHLGYEGLITPNELRFADYSDISNNNKALGLKTVKDVYNMYHLDITNHNNLLRFTDPEEEDS